MPRLRSAPPAKAKKGFVLQKPNGQLTPRVQAVSPEHFGIVAIDCAKARSRFFLADFYGRVLLEPTTLPSGTRPSTVRSGQPSRPPSPATPSASAPSGTTARRP